MELLPQTPPLLLLLLLSTEQRGATLTTDATGQSADAMLKTPSFLLSFLLLSLVVSLSLSRGFVRVRLVLLGAMATLCIGKADRVPFCCNEGRGGG